MESYLRSINKTYCLHDAWVVSYNELNARNAAASLLHGAMGPKQFAGFMLGLAKEDKREKCWDADDEKKARMHFFFGTGGACRNCFFPFAASKRSARCW